MSRRAFAFGFFAALGAACWTLLEFSLGWHGELAHIGAFTGFVGLVFPIVAIVLAVRAARRGRSEPMGFAAALAEGASVSVVFSLLGGLFFWTYFAVINPGYREAGRALDPLGQALASSAASLAAGLLISAVVALAMRSTLASSTNRPRYPRDVQDAGAPQRP